MTKKKLRQSDSISDNNPQIEVEEEYDSDCRETKRIKRKIQDFGDVDSLQYKSGEETHNRFAYVNSTDFKILESLENNKVLEWINQMKILQVNKIDRNNLISIKLKNVLGFNLKSINNAISIDHWDQLENDEFYDALIKASNFSGKSIVNSDLSTNSVEFRIADIKCPALDNINNVNAYLSEIQQELTTFGYDSDPNTIKRLAKSILFNINKVDNLRNKKLFIKLKDVDVTSLDNFFYQVFLFVRDAVASKQQALELYGWETVDHPKAKGDFEQGSSRKFQNIGYTRSVNKSNNRHIMSSKTNDLKKGSQVVCFGCGRPNHKRTECRLKSHPHFNSTRDSWFNSEWGKAYKKLVNRDCLPASFKLKNMESNSTIALKELKGRKQSQNNAQADVHDNTKGIHSLYMINEDLLQEASIIVEILLPNCSVLQTNALVDTGALKYNYISMALANQLVEMGLAFDCIRITSSLAVSRHVYISSRRFNIKIKFFNEFSQEFEIIDCVLIDLDIPYGIIFGRQFIICHRLLHKLVKHFTLNETEVRRRMDCHQSLVSFIVNKNDLLDYESDGDDMPLPFENQIFDSEMYNIAVTNDSINKNSVNNNCNFINIQGSVYLQSELRKLCYEDFADLFSESVDKEPADVPPCKLEVNTVAWEVKANRLPPRAVSTVKREAQLKQIQHMLDMNVIEPSSATSYSQSHLVPKKTPGEFRYCIDYRRLNLVMKSRGWPIPNIAHTLERIGQKRASRFGSMDLVAGYHQFPMHDDSKYLTAFITCLGTLYQFKRLSMGLKVSGSYFMEIMITVVLANLIYEKVECYFDDVLVFGTDDVSFVNNLRSVFERFRKYRIKLNPKKCIFGAATLEFLGHQIDAEGITFTNEKLLRAQEIVKPTNVVQLQSFIGTMNHFRPHIQNLSMLTSPLQKLIQKGMFAKQTLQWTNEASMAFDILKDCLTKLPKLYFINETGSIWLHTDASDYGIGAYLFQEINNIEFPIAFISKSLTGSQLNWSTIEKEAYAIVYAFKKLEYLIRDRKFTLKTDHANLVYVNTNSSKKVYNWKLIIQEFDFDIFHIAGSKNIIADTFSRLLLVSEDSALSADTVHIINPELISDTSDILSGIPYLLAVLSSDDDTTIDNVTYSNAQRKIIGKVHNTLMGHFGVDTTLQKLKQSGHDWHLIRQHVKRFIKHCPCCQKMSLIKVPIQSLKYTVHSNYPMQKIAIDTITGLPIDIEGNNSIIVIIDCFTRFIELYPTKNLTAHSAAYALLQHCGRYGFADKILSDNGSQYVNEIIRELIKIIGSEHSLILAYSHEENAIVERANREVLRHLTQLIFHSKIVDKWFYALPLIQRIMNANVHSSIGCSPAQLLFGNAISLDRNLIDGSVENNSPISMSEWASTMIKLQNQLIQIAYKMQLEHHVVQTRNNASESTIVFPVNSYVLVKYHSSRYHTGKPNKVNTKWRGPLKVQNILGNNYTLLNLVNNKYEDHHIKDLKKFEYDVDYVSPEDIALRDSQYYIVEQVIQHRGDTSLKSSLQFFVKWKGYDSSENTWESYKILKDNSVLHQYLRSNNLNKLILPKYKVPEDTQFLNQSNYTLRKYPVVITDFSSQTVSQNTKSSKKKR